jgi:hypothetical protein
MRELLPNQAMGTDAKRTRAADAGALEHVEKVRAPW